MDTKLMIVLLAAVAAVLGAIFFVAHASVQRTQATAGATVLRAQEHTKRADGRHELLDFFNKLRRIDP